MIYLFPMKYFNGELLVRYEYILLLIQWHQPLFYFFIINGGFFFIQYSVLIYYFLFFFCELLFDYWFILSILLDDLWLWRFKIISWLGVLVKLIQVVFSICCDFWEKVLNFVGSEFRPGYNMVGVVGFDEFLYGRNYFIFVVELGQL